MKWGINLVEPLKKATGNKQCLIVAINYFSKWIEAEPLTKITAAAMKSFVWKNIICRFGI